MVPRLVPPVIAAGSIAKRGQPVLSGGGGVRLRPWESDDCPALIGAFADLEIQRWHSTRIDSPGEADAWIEGTWTAWRSEAASTWAIVVDDSPEPVGRVSLYFHDLPNGLGEISYWVVPPARGAGLATAGVTAVATWAFDELGMHRVEIAHSVANPSSCRVASKAGFQPEGTRSSALLHIDGWHDMHVHRRIATT